MTTTNFRTTPDPDLCIFSRIFVGSLFCINLIACNAFVDSFATLDQAPPLFFALVSDFFDCYYIIPVVGLPSNPISAIPPRHHVTPFLRYYHLATQDLRPDFRCCTYVFDILIRRSLCPFACAICYLFRVLFSFHGYTPFDSLYP